MSKGILIYALGHENYYKMAVVLAASIKVNDALPICLITDRQVKPEHIHLFKMVKNPLKKSIYNGDKVEYIKAKLYMYDYSPFDETIFLDVDQVMIAGRKLSPVFTELKDIEVTFSNTGKAEISIWADIKEVQKIYGDKPFWNFHSEFVYFKKGAAKKYFDAAKKVYEDDKIKSATKFANATMADELAFQAAAMITGIFPHKENWAPNFWYDSNQKDSRKYPYQLTDHITYSIGGKTTPGHVKINYNILAKHYFAKLGLSNPYRVIDKQYYLPERKLF
ncbi:MAG: hypothetical protein JWO92_2551 [Chitinophagaceae bacterium]|nr:hypothetical protein [Chitinophagaceae bacterium]